MMDEIMHYYFAISYSFSMISCHSPLKTKTLIYADIDSTTAVEFRRISYIIYSKSLKEDGMYDFSSPEKAPHGRHERYR